MATVIYVGQEFGSRTVIKVGRIESFCRCKCGKESRIRNSFLVRGRSTACRRCCGKRVAPARRLLGTDSKLYHFLMAKVRNAIGRCTDKDHPLWKYYGGRGIRVYRPWVTDPVRFFKYLLTLPGHADRSLVIDRKNNNGHYEPGNLRFATRSESQRNKNPYGLKSAVQVGATYGNLMVIKIDGKAADCVCVCGRSVRTSLGSLVYGRKGGSGGRCCPSCAAKRSYAARRANVG